MGVFKLFGGSCHSSESSPSKTTLPNPNPGNFQVLDIYQNKSGLNYPVMVKIKYPDADNFEGIKILIFTTYSYYRKCCDLNNLDPHFFPSSRLICRLHPDQWELGKRVIELLRRK